MSKTAICSAILYVALMGGLVVWHHMCAQPKPAASTAPAKTLTAARSLPANYLLRDGDLQGDGKKSDLTGKYTVKPVAQSATIDGDGVADEPVIGDTHDGLLRLEFSTKAADAGYGNAESKVLICRNEEKLAVGRVVVQQCDDAASACHLLVTPADAAPPLTLGSLRAAVNTCALAPADGPDVLK